MNDLNIDSVSSNQTVSVSTIAENTLLQCRRCKNYFSITSLHDGYCFSCQSERDKEKQIKALGFDYIPAILNGKEPKHIHIATRRRKLKTWTMKGAL